jgi:hypothetical protein
VSFLIDEEGVRGLKMANTEEAGEVVTAKFHSKHPASQSTFPGLHFY